MDVPLDHAPQSLDSRSREILERSRAYLGLVDRLVVIEGLARVVASPVVGDDLGSFLNVVSDHLKASHLGPVSHHESPDVLRASLVEAKHPHFSLLSAFSVMSELGLIDLNRSTVKAEFVLAILVLEVNVDHQSDSSIDVVHIAILQVRDLVLPKISKCLKSIESSREVVEDDPQDLHETQMRVVEDGPFPYVAPYVFTSHTSERDAILLSVGCVLQTHQHSTLRTVPLWRQHSLGHHPPQSSLVVLGHSIHLQVMGQTLLDHVSLQRLGGVLCQWIVTQVGLRGVRRDGWIHRVRLSEECQSRQVEVSQERHVLVDVLISLFILGPIHLLPQSRRVLIEQHILSRVFHDRRIVLANQQLIGLWIEHMLVKLGLLRSCSLLRKGRQGESSELLLLIRLLPVKLCE